MGSIVVLLVLGTLLQQFCVTASSVASDEAEELLRMLAAAELRDSLPRPVPNEPTGPSARDSTTARAAGSRGGAKDDAVSKLLPGAPDIHAVSERDSASSSARDHIRKDAGEKEADHEAKNGDTDSSGKEKVELSRAKREQGGAEIVAASGSMSSDGCPTLQRVPRNAASIRKISAQLLSSLSPSVMQLVQVLLVGFAGREERQLVPALQHELRLYSQRQSRPARPERGYNNHTAPALVALNLRQMYDVEAPAPSRRQTLERNVVRAVIASRSSSAPIGGGREPAKGGRCAGGAVQVLGSSYLLYGLLARPLGGTELRGPANSVSAAAMYHRASVKNFTAGHHVAEDSAALTLFVLAPRLAAPNISSTLPLALDALQWRAITRSLACAVHQSARAVLARPQCAVTQCHACKCDLPLLAKYEFAFDSWRRQHDISTTWRRSMSVLEQEIGSKALSHQLSSRSNRKIAVARSQPHASSVLFMGVPRGKCTVNALDAVAIATSTLLHTVMECVDMLSVGSNSEAWGIRQAMDSAAEAARVVAALVAIDEELPNVDNTELQKHEWSHDVTLLLHAHVNMPKWLSPENHFPCLVGVGGAIISAGLAWSISSMVWNMHTRLTAA